MQREYGIDLLKIIAMVFIVLDHILLWGGWGFCSGQTDMKGLVLESLDALCLCHVNCFVLASGWIMSRLDFKVIRIVRLWLQVWGYSLAFLVVALCIPSLHVGLRDVLKNLLPIAEDRYWFFTQYTILFFAMPILNAAIRNLEFKILTIILVVGFVCFSIQPFVFKTDIFHLNRGYSALWFMYLYLLSGVMATRGLFANVPKLVAIVAAAFGWVGGIAFLHIRGLHLFGLEKGFNPNLFRAYNCPFIFLYSLSMLVIFSRMNDMPERIKKVIAMVAPSVFAVYVIHSNRFFRALTDWNVTWTHFLNSHSSLVCVFSVVVSSLLIFSACISIDFCRRNCFHRFCGRKKWRMCGGLDRGNPSEHLDA